ncbi:AAA family ATPase [Acinetobacter haemolyticus]|nr:MULTISPECIES: ATP-dependent helicase [Acinetobacter]EEH70357.1 UvrD/REP helicase [Acinetobacter sp. ATCC 27244]MDH1917169.1 ATP-dependent helicase [Acinetobacter junii]NAR80904.1 AAA family ATPase [Acinetobacter haemolyticus]NAR91018.1 AAA family ATPase [Acinetobacter haemolyticus]NAR96666.1 AAA family ATPase [Acinetobacter haemolyticus]
MKFTDEQLHYIERTQITENIFLNACPGSGKTETIAQRVANEVESWANFPSGIAVLSFTKSAAKEIEHRIKEKIDNNTTYPHFIGTFDSFILKNIVNPLSKDISKYEGHNGDYSFKVVNYDSQLFFLTKYPHGYQKISGHHVEIDNRTGRFKFHTPNKDTNRALNAMVLEQWQKDDIYRAKKKCRDAGFLTHKDIEYLAESALTTRTATQDYAKKLAKRFQLIIVDECQDLSFEQLNILKAMMLNGTKLHFVGDLNQSIYEFRDVDPNDIINFITDNGFREIQLTKNFRSCQKIVNIATNIMKSGSIEADFTSPEQSCFVLQYKDSPSEVISQFNELTKQYSNRVLVARGHQTLNQLSIVDSTPAKPVEFLLSSILNFDETSYTSINQSLIDFSKYIKDKVKLETKSSDYNCPQIIASELDWRLFLHNSIQYLLNHDLQLDSCTWTNWCKKVNAVVINLFKQEFVLSEIYEALKNSDFKIRSPSGKATHCISNYHRKNDSLDIKFRKSTIHGVKGETHEATMLISNPTRNGTGTHWSHWIGDKTSEAARFAYVASSRPKYILVWCVKKLKSSEQKDLESLGFEILDIK